MNNDDLKAELDFFHAFLAYPLPAPPAEYAGCLEARRIGLSAEMLRQCAEADARVLEMRTLCWVGREGRLAGEALFAKRWIEQDALDADSDDTLKKNRESRYGDMSDVEATQYFTFQLGGIGVHCSQNFAENSVRDMNLLWRARQAADRLDLDYRDYINAVVGAHFRSAQSDAELGPADLCSDTAIANVSAYASTRNATS